MNLCIVSKSCRKFWLPRYLGLAILALCLPSHSKPLYNGVSINGLNGFDGDPNHQTLSYLGTNNEKFCYVLDHLGDSPANPDLAHRTKIPDQLASTFAAYQNSGVNLIRIPIHPGFDLGCDPNEYGEDLYNGGGWSGGVFYPYWPAPANENARDNRISTVKTFITLATTYGLKVEIQFQTIALTSQAAGMVPDIYGDINQDPASGEKYHHDKNWIRAWMTGLGTDLSRVAVVNLVQEAFIHSHYPKPDGSYYMYPDVGKTVADDWTNRTNSHGDYIIDLWRWFKANYVSCAGCNPSFKTTAEIWTMAWDETQPNAEMQYVANPGIVAATANWIGANLPGISYAGMETYFYLPSPSSIGSDYLATEKSLLSSYFSSTFYQTTQTPLWIDEYGHSACVTVGASCPFDGTTQDAYYYGVLNATEQYSSQQIAGRVSWAATNDHLYDGVQEYGLFSAYDVTNTPVPRPAWNNVTSFYRGNPLAVPSTIVPLLAQ